jgi:hypothetical protein
MYLARLGRLRVEGVGILLTHPLKEWGSQGTCPCCDLGDERRSAPKWATLRLLTQSPKGMLFGHCVHSCAFSSCARGEGGCTL